jgi:hypothetical protein
MLGLVCGSFLRLLVFAQDLVRVVLGFFPLFFGFKVLGVFSCFLGGGIFWDVFCSLGFMGVSFGFWVFGAFGICVRVGSCGFSSVG